jgi:hypothetical protein
MSFTGALHRILHENRDINDLMHLLSLELPENKANELFESIKNEAASQLKIPGNRFIRDRLLKELHSIVAGSWVNKAPLTNIKACSYCRLDHVGIELLEVDGNYLAVCPVTGKDIFIEVIL